MIQPQARRPWRTVFAAGALLTVLVTPLACSGHQPVEETVDELSSITETPPEEASSELEELDAELHPEFQADPLECSDILVLTVRGTGEPSNKQLLSPVARLVEESRPGMVEVHDIDYPANGEMRDSASVGERQLIDTLNQQHELCPEQRFVLMGYSQGALVVGESLIPAEERLVGAHVGAVQDSAAEAIVAIVLYADPRFVGSDPFGVGNYSPLINGLLERPAGLLDHYADRMRSYCVGHDFVCQASTELDEEGHVAYYSNGMQQDGAAFVITQLGEPVAESPPESSPDNREEDVER